MTALTLLHEQQFRAIVNADADFSRFDILIHLATEKKQQAKYPADSYETWGSEPGKPPVPGFAVSSYKPGMCWKVAPGAQTYQIGSWVPCSQWRKHKE